MSLLQVHFVLREVCVCRSRTRPATGEFERGGVKETASAMATQPRPTPFKAKVHMPSLLEELLAHAGQPGRAASMFALFRAIRKGGGAAASIEPFISLTWPRRAPRGFFRGLAANLFPGFSRKLP
jgi:hypothetical protein